MKHEMLAMILAGGQGTRLGPLTKNLAKPAVPFGGKYRIIDFVLSNCTNSGVKRVAVLTQYQPLVLNAHIGSGAAWDMDMRDSGVTILQPFASSAGEMWFNGTSHAIYQNIPFMDSIDPKYVLILSGDHIYKMNYNKMLNYHKQKNAALTIAVIEVPWDEAPRFGIMNTDDEYKIVEFEEKPKNPKSNLASMGIYIFDYKLLKEYLIKAAKDDNKNDFGKDIIPMFLNNNEAVYAYPYKGYWKDVGTIDSLWQANMDLLDPDSTLDINDQSWRIYGVNHTAPAQFISKDAKVKDSLVVEGCIVKGEVNRSVLSMNCKVGKNTKITDSVIMKNTVIEDDVIINKALIGENAIIKRGSVIGDGKEIAVVAEYSVVEGKN